MNVAIIGIHTGIGKTLASAIICEALQADYWKPVQAGNLNHTDSDEVKSLLSNSKTVIHKEAYALTQPMSAHAAAKLDSKIISFNSIAIPETKNHLVIETAGGIMSPINDEQTNLDFVVHFKLPVILVSQHYLGSINHTLLTASALKSKGVVVKGILFNGADHPSTQEYILNYTGMKSLGRMNLLTEVSPKTVAAEAKRIASAVSPAFA